MTAAATTNPLAPVLADPTATCPTGTSIRWQPFADDDEAGPVPRADLLSLTTAELLAHAANLAHDRDSYRQLALAAVAQLAEATQTIRRLEATCRRQSDVIRVYITPEQTRRAPLQLVPRGAV